MNNLELEVLNGHTFIDLNRVVASTKVELSTTATLDSGRTASRSKLGRPLHLC